MSNKFECKELYKIEYGGSRKIFDNFKNFSLAWNCHSKRNYDNLIGYFLTIYNNKLYWELIEIKNSYPVKPVYLHELPRKVHKNKNIVNL